MNLSNLSSRRPSIIEKSSDVLILKDEDLLDNSPRKFIKRQSAAAAPLIPSNSLSMRRLQKDTPSIDAVSMSNTNRAHATTPSLLSQSKDNLKSPSTRVVGLDGVTLSTMLTKLVETRGFEDLYAETNLRCFKVNPSIKSSLKVF